MVGREGAREREGKAGCGQRGQQASEHARRSKERGETAAARSLLPTSSSSSGGGVREGREGKGRRHRWWASSVRARAACTLYTKMKEGSDGRTDDTNDDVLTYIRDDDGAFPLSLAPRPLLRRTNISPLPSFLPSLHLRRTRHSRGRCMAPARRKKPASIPFLSSGYGARERRRCGRRRRRLKWLRFMLYRIIYT